MRMGTVKSDLIAKIGYQGNTMRVLYTDGATFDYFGVPLSTFKAIVRSKSPGHDWIRLRSQYKYQQV